MMYLVQYRTNEMGSDYSAVVSASSMFEAQAKFIESLEPKFRKNSIWKIELTVESILEIK